MKTKNFIPYTIASTESGNVNYLSSRPGDQEVTSYVLLQLDLRISIKKDFGPYTTIGTNSRDINHLSSKLGDQAVTN
jgi:hypothetical protein